MKSIFSCHKTSGQPLPRLTASLPCRARPSLFKPYRALFKISTLEQIKAPRDLSSSLIDPAVNARTLHQTLESKQQFADWIKAKVLDNPFFMENQDYVLLQNSMKQTSRGGHNRKDYALTLDTAKKVAMAEQTEKGETEPQVSSAIEITLRYSFQVNSPFSISCRSPEKKINIGTHGRPFLYSQHY